MKLVCFQCVKRVAVLAGRKSFSICCNLILSFISLASFGRSCCYYQRTCLWNLEFMIDGKFVLRFATFFFIESAICQELLWVLPKVNFWYLLKLNFTAFIPFLPPNQQHWRIIIGNLGKWYKYNSCKKSLNIVQTTYQVTASEKHADWTLIFPSTL